MTSKARERSLREAFRSLKKVEEAAIYAQRVILVSGGPPDEIERDMIQLVYSFLLAMWGYKSHYKEKQPNEFDPLLHCNSDDDPA